MAQKTIEQRYNTYMEEIKFEEIEKESLTDKKILAIESKHGIVILTESSTDLWITRKISVMEILRIPTIMESMLDEFQLRDSFGMILWEGTAEEIKEFVSGFNS